VRRNPRQTLGAHRGRRGGRGGIRRHFAEWAAAWEAACEQAGTPRRSIGIATNLAASIASSCAGAGERGGSGYGRAAGHGTYDGKEAKFNLRGPDVSSSDLADWLKPFRRSIAVIDAASASAPFINKLSGTNRVILSATRSGAEINYARFGKFLSEAIADLTADLDKDGQTSLLEAFLTASRRVAEYYSTEGRMVTEHALLDDNGDGLGTSADWFRGIRAVKSAKDGAPLDGFRAHQFHLVQSEAERKLPPGARARRDELELSIAKLRRSKAQLAEDDYYQQLESLLLEMARLHESAEASPTGASPRP
jgi:hypothetical protein